MICAPLHPMSHTHKCATTISWFSSFEPDKLIESSATEKWDIFKICTICPNCYLHSFTHVRRLCRHFAIYKIHDARLEHDTLRTHMHHAHGTSTKALVADYSQLHSHFISLNTTLCGWHYTSRQHLGCSLEFVVQFAFDRRIVGKLANISLQVCGGYMCQEGFSTPSFRGRNGALLQNEYFVVNCGEVEICAAGTWNISEHECMRYENNALPSDHIVSMLSLFEEEK